MWLYELRSIRKSKTKLNNDQLLASTGVHCNYNDLINCLSIYLFVCLFVGVLSLTREMSLIWRRHHFWWRALNFTYTRHSGHWAVALPDITTYVCRGWNSNTQPSACGANALTDYFTNHGGYRLFCMLIGWLISLLYTHIAEYECD